MEPTAETRESLRGLARHGDEGLADELSELGALARRLVPELVGLSLALVEESLTFTLVAEAQLQAMDAMQYLDDGPCVTAVRENDVVWFSQDDVLDESQWSLFSQATAAAGIGSTLSIPVVQDDKVVASINLYASTAHAFDGRHNELAAALGGWSPGIVADADLAFRTRLESAVTLSHVQDRAVVEQAVELVVDRRRIHPVAALILLQTSAARSGITTEAIARVLLATYRQHAESSGESRSFESG